MADLKYPGDTPVPDPVSPVSAPRKMMRKPMVKPKGRPMYPDSVPVPDPVSPSAAPTGMPAMKKGGSVSSASKRADGCATKGKTKGRMI